MNPALLRAYATMMPRLQAEEELRMLSTLAVGTGAASKPDRRAHIRALTRVVQPNAPKQRASLDDMRAAGIVVEEVPVG